MKHVTALKRAKQALRAWRSGDAWDDTPLGQRAVDDINAALKEEKTTKRKATRDTRTGEFVDAGTEKRRPASTVRETIES